MADINQVVSDCDEIANLGARMIREREDAWFLVAPSRLVILNPRLRAAFRFGVGGYRLSDFGALTDKKQKLQDAVSRCLTTGADVFVRCTLRGRSATISLHRMVCPLATPDCDEGACAVVLGNVCLRQ